LESCQGHPAEDLRSSASIDVVFQRDGAHVVYLNDTSGSYRGRQFVTPGVQPRVTPSQGMVFLAYTGTTGSTRSWPSTATGADRAAT
jgi:hypothetical protein